MSMSGLRRQARVRSTVQLIGAGFLWLAGSSSLHSTTRLPPPPVLPPESDAPKPAGNSLKWKTVELQLPNQTGLVPLKAEVADNEAKRERGMMYRKSLPENSGMLFVLDPPARAAFWMKNTRVLLSLAFIDGQGRILEIRSIKPNDETVVWSVLIA